jgi:hypothetical protein
VKFVTSAEYDDVVYIILVIQVDVAVLEALKTETNISITT